MNNGIFISYRHDDSSTIAGIIDHELGKHFFRDNIFRDKQSLQSGSTFKEEIVKAIENSFIVLVIITRNWVQKFKTQTTPDTEPDFIVFEIQTALNNNIDLIPVLIDNAEMPKKEDLPESIRPVCERQSFVINPDIALMDINRLVEVVKSRRRYIYEEKTLTGAAERIIKDPVGTMKNGLKANIEFFKKDYTYWKNILGKKK